MNNFLIYISSFLIICSYVGYFLLIFIYNKNKISNDNSFDISKEIISEYNNINVIEHNGYFSIYNIKRKVIKLSKFCYYGNSLSSICLSLIEVGYSILDRSKNLYIDFFRKFISNLKVLYIFPILAILINCITYTIGDVRLSIVIILFFAVITYILIGIKSNLIDWICSNINKVNCISKNNSFRIINFLNKILWLDKFIFFGELIIIIRFVTILLKIN